MVHEQLAVGIAPEIIIQVIVGFGQFGIGLLLLPVNGLQFLVDRLQLFVRAMHLFIGGLQFLVIGLDVFIRGIDQFVTPSFPT
jgi:hypothetical protein